MATTLSLEIKKTPTSQGRFPIFIRITKDRKPKRIKTSVSLKKLADWNPKGAKNQNWVRTSERNAEAWNDALAKELEEATSIYRENKQASAELIAKKVKGEGVCASFLAYARSQVEEKEALAKGDFKQYRTFLKKLESYLAANGRSDMLFSELSPSFVSDFETFLRKETNSKFKTEVKVLHPNYVRCLLVKLKAVVNKAINEGLLPMDKYPFRTHPIPKEVGTGKEALDAAEIDAIISLEYPEGGWLWNAKNAFLFSYYCAGIRSGDLLQLRWRNITDDGTRLEYIMGKNHKQRNYPLVKQAKDILAMYRTEASQPSDYIFPLLDSGAAFAKYADLDTMPVEMKKQLHLQISSKNAILNSNLKKVAVDAGISKTLSFHISRHSFASLAREQKVSSKIVQEALAHSSLTTTERYLHDFGSDEVSATLEKMFSSPAKSQQEVLLGMLKSLPKDELNALINKLGQE